MQKNTYALLVAASFLTSLPLALEAYASPLALGLMLAAQAVALGLITLGKPPKSFHTAWPFSGLVIAVALVSGPNIFTLATLLSLCGCAFVLRAGHMPWLQINRFLLATFTSLVMWPAASSFEVPYPAAGLFLLTLLMLLGQHRISSRIELTARITLLAATTLIHPILTLLPLLTGFTLFAVWPKRALAVTSLGTALTIGLYELFSAHWWEVVAESTLHTLEIGPEGLAAFILLAVVVTQSIYHWRWWTAPHQLAWLLTTLFGILILSGATETTTLALSLPLITHTLLRPTYKA